MESIRNCGDKMRFAAMEKDSEDLREMSRQGAEILRLATGFRIKQEKEEGETVKLAKGVKEFRDGCIEQGREEGRAQGIRTGELQTLFKLVQNNYISMELGAREAGMSTEEFHRSMMDSK